MKKLILVSMLYQVTDLVQTITPELEGKTVTYIPTAGIAEDVEGMVEEETSTLESLGMTVDVLEVSSASYDSIVNSLTKNDTHFCWRWKYIFPVTGVKAFRRRSDTDPRSGKRKIVHRRVGRIDYNLPGHRYCADMDSPEKAPDLTDYAGLNLVDFYIVPHIGNEEMGESAQKAVENIVPNLN